jgi:uncharacterized membrane protein
MSNLFVVGFDEPHKAEEVSLKLQELQSEYLLDLEEVVVAVKDEKGKVKLRQAGSLLTADDAVFAGFCGSLTALIFLNATTGAASGALADVGITHHFIWVAIVSCRTVIAPNPAKAARVAPGRSIHLPKRCCRPGAISSVATSKFIP